MNPEVKKSQEQTLVSKSKIEKKDLGPDGKKEAVKKLEKDPGIKKSKAELLKAVESRETTEKKVKRGEVLKQLDSKIEETLPKGQNIDSLAKIIKKPDGTDFDTPDDAKEFLREQYLKGEIHKLTQEKPLIGKDGKALKTKEGKTIMTSDYIEALKKNPELGEIKDQKVVKELMAIYGTKTIGEYAEVLKGVNSLEQANELIKKEALAKLKEAGKNARDKDGNPLTQEQKEKYLKGLEQEISSNPESAYQFAEKMSGYKGISESQARNVQPEALNLTGNARERTLNLIKHFEGFVSKSFWDYKQWTRGYGTKAPGAGATISKEKANKELGNKINTEYNLKNELTKIGMEGLYSKLGDNQIAALTSFIFNLGTGKLKNIKGVLQQFEKTGDPKVVGNKILLYNKAGGKILSGLVRRRKTEAKLFEEGGKKDQIKDGQVSEQNKQVA